MRKTWVNLVLSLFLSFYGSVGFASTIDWTGFHPITPSDPVSRTNEATIEFTESFDLAAVYYLNELYSVPNFAGILSFDWEIILGSDDADDYLTFVAYDQSGNTIANAEFPAASGGGLSGFFNVNLSPYQGTDIFLAWGFVEGDFNGNDDSTARIFNIDLSVQEIEPVPEPSTLILLGAGLLIWTGYGKKRV